MYASRKGLESLLICAGLPEPFDDYQNVLDGFICKTYTKQKAALVLLPQLFATFNYHMFFNLIVYILHTGSALAQCLTRPRGCWLEPHRRHCVVSLSKNIYPSLVLVQPRKTRPFITERLLMGLKESNQIKQTTYYIPFVDKIRQTCQNHR